VCGSNWNIFAVCSILDNIPDDVNNFPELLKSVRSTLGTIDADVPPVKEEKKNLKKNQSLSRTMRRKKILKMKLKKSQRKRNGVISGIVGNIMMLIIMLLLLILGSRIKANEKI
jgi:hypothetical protein